MKSKYRLADNGEVGLGLINHRISSVTPHDDRSRGRRFKHFSADVMTAKSMTAAEKIQLVMQLKWGLGEVPDVFTKEFHARVMRTILAFEALYLFLVQTEEFNSDDMDSVEELSAAYVKVLCATFGPNSSLGYNCNKPKTHALCHLVMWLWLFGSWYNWCTSLFEKAHKVSKNHYGRTNGREDLQGQMMDREALHSAVDSALAVAAEQERERTAPMKKCVRYTLRAD